MKNIIYSTLLVVSLIASIAYIGAKFADSYTASCAKDKAQIERHRKELTLQAKWFRELTPHQQDSVKRLIEIR